jgi:hypothetical protein
MEPRIDAGVRRIFHQALDALDEHRVPFVVAGAFALNHYTGVWRNTKDLDVFCEPRHAGRALAALASAGFQTVTEEAHWLGKAFQGDAMVDVIWGGGNWATFVDADWFRHARRGKILGRRAAIAPPEDIILSKAYVAGRERYDGTDIAHLIHACSDQIDWDRMVARFGDHWALLLQYLVLYRFVYPEARDRVPAELVRKLAARIGTDDELADGLSFRGPLVDRYAYLHDLRYEGRVDPREIVAARAGYPVSTVRRRRELDSVALDGGKVYGPPCQHADEPETATAAGGAAESWPAIESASAE